MKCLTAYMRPLLLALAAAGLPLTSMADSVTERIDGFKANRRAIAAIEDALAHADQVTVAEQARLMARFAERIPSLYPPDAKGGFFSQAKSDIWVRFPEFTQKAQALQQSARQLEQAAQAQPSDVAMQQMLLRQVKTNCLACHEQFKRGRP